MKKVMIGVGLFLTVAISCATPMKIVSYKDKTVEKNYKIVMVAMLDSNYQTREPIENLLRDTLQKCDIKVFRSLDILSPTDKNITMKELLLRMKKNDIEAFLRITPTDIKTYKGSAAMPIWSPSHTSTSTSGSIGTTPFYANSSSRTDSTTWIPFSYSIVTRYHNIDLIDMTTPEQKITWTAQSEIEGDSLAEVKRTFVRNILKELSKSNLLDFSLCHL